MMAADIEKGDLQIPRNSLYWLIAAQFAVTVPHLPRMPWWLLLILALAGIWRVMIFRGAWSIPRERFRFLLAVTCLLGIGWYFRPVLGLEALTALLLCAFYLKMLEMKSQRDAILLIYLAWFIIMVEFLFDQGIQYVVYEVFAFIVVTAALIGLNQSRGHRRPLGTLRLAAVLAAQSLPLMLVLFVFFPRVAPLWSVGLQEQRAKTGMGDSISPGDVASLGQSAEVAFRVSFEGAVPPRSSLYWRGVVFSNFDGRSWRRSRMDQDAEGGRRTSSGFVASQRIEAQPRGQPLRYEVIQEPSNRRWLFSLGLARSTTSGVRATDDARLVNFDEVDRRMAYQVSSWQDYLLEPELTPERRRHFTHLPSAFNDASRAFAERLRARYSDDAALADAVLRHFNQEPFVYTLQPPALGASPVDAFLFGTRRGFCEHYASAFVYLMRAAGIPARVVGGYQGAQTSSDGAYLIVRQYDAHAWAEVWLPGRGWVEYDPTAAVAPERVELGLLEATRSELGSLPALSQLRLGRVPLMVWLQMQSDMLNYYWSRFVLGYDARSQTQLFRNWFGKVDWEQLVIAMFLLLGSIYAVLVLVLFRHTRQQKPAPLQQAWLKFCRQMESRGVARRVGEGPLDYGLRCQAVLPGQAEVIDQVVRAYVDMNYGAGGVTPDGLSQLRGRVARLRKALPMQDPGDRTEAGSRSLLGTNEKGQDR